MITESLILFLSAVMSLNNPEIPAANKKENSSTTVAQQKTATTSANIRGGWDHN